MIELNKDLSENGLKQGFNYYSKYNKVKGKIKNKKNYREKVRKYYVVNAILIFSLSSAFISGLVSNPIIDVILAIPGLLILYCLLISPFYLEKRKIKNETLLLEKYLNNQPNGKLEIWEFGINLFYKDEKIKDICWGNLNSIAIYEDIIIFDCKFSNSCFFINSQYENEVKKALEAQNMLRLCVDMRNKGEVK